ncbi:Eukaryotic translation initiation factor 2-alpha kinase, partial [Linnemannia exigua]
YASPEQLARPNLGYDQKADIYSLGIIFFELYHPFSTLMERHAVLRTLRNGELPTEFVSRWPKEAAFVLWLMAEDPRMRPTAAEILEFDLIRKVKEESGTTTAIGGTPTEDEGGSMTASAASHHHHHHHDHHRHRRVSGRVDGHGSGKEDLRGLGLLTDTDVNKSGGSGGSDSSTPRVSSLTGKSICETCQARCRCSMSPLPSSLSTIAPTSGSVGLVDQKMSENTGAKAEAEAEANPSKVKPKDPSKRLSSSSHHGHGHSSRGHRSSKSISQKMSRTELENKLNEETERSKRLEMSLEAMRAEQKALLDRIQALEYEKELSWGAGGGGSGVPAEDDDEL